MIRPSAYKKKNNFKSFACGPIFFTFILLAILIGIMIPIYRSLTQRYKINREILELRREVGQLEASNQDFKKMLSYLESEQFAESEARLNLGLKKKGEEVFVINKSGLDKAGEKTSVAEEGEDASNFSKWWAYFFEVKN